MGCCLYPQLLRVQQRALAHMQSLQVRFEGEEGGHAEEELQDCDYRMYLVGFLPFFL